MNWGRLPFADDDPTTAKVTAKALLPVHDNGIKDPLILDQIYAHVWSQS